MRKGQRGRWVTHEVLPDWVSLVHPIAAVYAVYMDGALAYVGQSTDAHARMIAHGLRWTANGVRTPWGVCKRCSVKISISKKYGDWLMREMRLIRRLQPLGNRKHVDRKHLRRAA